MDLTDLNATVTLLSGVAIVVGIVGVVVPMLPGLVVCWLGVLGWAIFADAGWGRWAVLAVATAITLVGTVVKYTWPGRNLKRTGVSNWSLFLGGVLGLIGFFVVPVVGLVLGFVAGIWLAELARLRAAGPAWRATWHGLKAVGLSMLIEMGAALAIAAVWIAGVVLA